MYLAEDLKHERKVAVKVLRPELAAVLGAERFVQEIKTTASLQHPHILPLFDSGRAGSADAGGPGGQEFLYYVMPYIEGETLRDKLNRETQLSVDEAVRIATAVADALEYAHRQGVIHRDVKPENILLDDGRPIVADFGIALAVSAAAGGRMTETGLSLGTPHYMSPEQATAEKDLTNRSDIYSLGSVLYEMLVGDPPHTGSSAHQIIMKIVADTPRPVTELRKTVPPHVAAAVARSLEKLPADRFRTASEFAQALGDAGFARLEPQRSRVQALRRSVWQWIAIGGVGTSLILASILAAIARAPPAGQTVRFVVSPVEGEAPAIGVALAFSPDGTEFVFGPRSEAGTMLRVRPLDTIGGRTLTGGEQPFYSPDGQWIGFFVDRQLMKVLAVGGPVQPVATVPAEYRGASWGPDDVIVFASVSGQLMRVTGTGGVPEPITTPDTSVGEFHHRFPHFLPDGETIVFTSWSGDVTNASVAALSVRSGQITRFDLRGMPVGYLPTGHLMVVSQDGTALAVPFDERGVEITGPPIPLFSDVFVPEFGPPALALSTSGSVVYATSARENGRTLVLVDHEGVETPLRAPPRRYQAPRFSPDGNRIIVAIDRVLWMYDITQETLSILPFDDGAVWHPGWTPDGRNVLFTADQRPEGVRLMTVPADRSGPAEVFFDSPDAIWEHALSPDGNWLGYRIDTEPPGLVRNLFVVSLREENPVPVAYAASPADQKMLTISPDGRWMAYVSAESGQDEVRVRSFPRQGAPVLVSRDGGLGPRWSPDGGALFYRSGGMMWMASLTAEPDFQVTARRPLFADAYQRGVVFAEYDVSPTDGRLLMIKTPQRNLTVITNLADELRSRLGR